MAYPRTLLLCALLGVGVLGCKQEEAGAGPKAVDVAAQVTGLKGNADAKSAALTELAAGGPNAAGAVNDIIPLLKDEDPVVRRLAAYALGQIGPKAKAALPNLTPLLEDSDRTVITSAMNAIRSIDPSKGGGEALPNTMGN